MTEHEQIREFLALAAAGALLPEEFQRIERHAALCAECAAELQIWHSLSQGLRRLPTPQPRPEIVERARALAEARLAEAAEERWNQRVMLFLTGFAWMMTLVSWPIYRLLSKGLLQWYQPGFVPGWMGFAAWTAFGWIAVGIAAVLLGQQKARERRWA